MGISLLRSAAWALAACAAAGLVRPLLHARGRAVRHCAWGLLILPFLTPPLVTGYAYTGPALRLLRHPGLKECLYGLLLTARYTLPAALVFHFGRPARSPEAGHCIRLLASGRQNRRLLRLGRLHADGLRLPATAFVLAFLFLFHDLELASLLMVRTWTVSLFDALAGGATLGELPGAVIRPALPGLLLLLWAASGLRKTAFSFVPRPPPATPGRCRKIAAWLCLAGGATLVTFVPAAALLPGLPAGTARGLRSGILLPDIAAGLFFGVLTGAVLCVLIRPADRCPARSLPWPRRRLLSVFLLWGLTGSLTVSLTVLALYNLPVAAAFRDSPLPLLTALVILLLPYAVLLRLALALSRDRIARHAARLLADGAAAVQQRGRRLRRRLEGPATALIFWTTFYLAYTRMTAAAILAPPGMSPVSVRLYNLMHYGRTPMLSAMVALATAAAVIPATLFFLVLHRQQKHLQTRL